MLLVTGLPGSVVPAAAKALEEYTSNKACWLSAPHGAMWCRDGAECDVAALRAGIEAAILSAPSPVALPERLALQTWGFVELQPAVRAVSAACASISLASVRLAAVVCCVDAPMALGPPAELGRQMRCAPGLLEQLDCGFAQALLVCHAQELGAARSAFLNQLLSSANPSASYIRAARGPRSAAAALAALAHIETVEQSAQQRSPFEALSQRQARMATSPGWKALPPAPVRPNRALADLVVMLLPPAPPVLIDRLVTKLRQAMPVSLLHASGVVTTTDGASYIDLSASTSRPPRDSAAASEPPSLLFVGRSISAREIGEMVLSCRPMPERRTLLTRDSLPEEDQTAIRTRLLHEVPLPAGMFHDGTSFVEMDGTRYADHPELACALDKLLDERNAAAAAHNAEVDSVLAALQTEADAYLQLVESNAAGEAAAELE